MGGGVRGRSGDRHQYGGIRGQRDRRHRHGRRGWRRQRRDAAGADADAKAQTGQIILNGLATGDVPAPDKAYLAQLVSAHTGVAPDESARRVDQAVADAKMAKVKLQQAADAARKAGVTLTIFTGLAMLIGAFIACAAAALGGQQRDVHG